MTRFGFEVEFLTGVSVASTPYKRDESEWPPHPDRLFQALVAAWGRNDPPDDGEQAALEWLEVLNHEYLAVSAPPAHPRSVAAAYVPPNDLQTTTRLRADAAKQKGSLAKQLAVIPSLRTNRVARFFPAMVPTAKPAVVRYSWVLDERQREAFLGHRADLERLAREVTYLGHSQASSGFSCRPDRHGGLGIKCRRVCDCLTSVGFSICEISSAARLTKAWRCDLGPPTL